MKLADTLRHINYHALDISDYSRNYILQLLPSLDYYLDICQHTLSLLPPTTHTLVDYGGGHGFLSLLAKQHGIPEVIYIDHNPQAAETVNALSARLGFGPDTVITGDQAQLKEWCDRRGIVPDALIGIDVIEHIYRLEPFFDTLYSLNPHMDMVFSTASTPYNPRIRQRLESIMLTDEYGDKDRKGFSQLRREYIASRRQDLTDKQLDQWASATRGLTYTDISTILQQSPDTALPDISWQPPAHPNTCDPATGNWTERILLLEDYQRIAHPRHITITKGFYNSHHHGLKGLTTRLLNLLLHLPGTLRLAPFIILRTEDK